MDEDWLDLVVEIGKTEENHKKEAEVLQKFAPKAQDKGKGKAAPRGGNTTADNSSNDLPDKFPRPANWQKLTEKEKKGTRYTNGQYHQGNPWRTKSEKGLLP